MVLSASTRRRWLGVIFLACAACLLICGLTILAARLRGLAFVVYWLICLLFTALAALVALADLRATARQARQEQLDLVQNAFGGIKDKTGRKRGKADVQTDK